MIKVIKEGVKGQVECDDCKAVLEYERQDIKGIQVGINEYDKVINCPCCNNEVSVRYKPIK